MVSHYINSDINYIQKQEWIKVVIHWDNPSIVHCTGTLLGSEKTHQIRIL